MSLFPRKSTDNPNDYTQKSYVIEEKFGDAKVFISHPNLCFTELRGRKSVYAAANIMHLSDLFADSICRLDEYGVEAMRSGKTRPTGRRMVLVHGKWGEQAWLLNTRKAALMVKGLDVDDLLDGASLEDVLIDWEDIAWEKAVTELYCYLSVDIRGKLGRLSPKKQRQIQWDAYLEAKEIARYKPAVLWNRIMIDIHALKGAYVTVLGRAIHKLERDECTRKWSQCTPNHEER